MSWKYTIRMTEYKGEKKRCDPYHIQGYRRFLDFWEPEQKDKWCQENCKGNYYMEAIEDHAHPFKQYIGYSFSFELEEDAVAFKLWWI